MRADVSSLIEARGIVKRFPGVVALKGVDFDLASGEVHSLVGENGAGKSTLVNILTGVLAPDEGGLEVSGRPVDFDSPRDARRAGIHVIHQELTFVPQLDVATNLALGALPIRSDPISSFFGVIDQEELRRRARRALVAAGAKIDSRDPAAKLSVAQAQLLEIARALDGDFRIILFDEPTSSLGPAERDELFSHIRRLRGSGIGVLYISHRLEEVIALSDRITVLRDGLVVATGPASAFDLDHIVRLMTGRHVEGPQHRARRTGETCLEVSGLSSPPQVADAGFVLRRGEIVGLAGLVGAGRTELAESLYGARPVSSGRIRLAGQTVRPSSPFEALRLGIGYATEDRKNAGIFHHLAIDLNIAIGALSRSETAPEVTRPGGWLKWSALAAMANRLAKRLEVRAPALSTQAGALSGGNQQKVVLARLVAARLQVLILDEPTRGVDVGAKAQIWQLLRLLADEGMALLVISSDITELIGTVDRLLVMRRGRIVAELDGGELSENRIMRHVA
jgi:ABC-type sugar transport system ATPase subunit